MNVLPLDENYDLRPVFPIEPQPVPPSRLVIGICAGLGFSTKLMANAGRQIPLLSGTWSYLGFILGGGVLGYYFHQFGERERFKHLLNLSKLELSVEAARQGRDTFLADRRKARAQRTSPEQHPQQQQQQQQHQHHS